MFRVTLSSVITLTTNGIRRNSTSLVTTWLKVDYQFTSEDVTLTTINCY